MYLLCFKFYPYLIFLGINLWMSVFLSVFFPCSIKPARKEALWASQCPTQPCWLTAMPSHRPVATQKVRRTLPAHFPSSRTSLASIFSVVYLAWWHGENDPVHVGKKKTGAEHVLMHWSFWNCCAVHIKHIYVHSAGNTGRICGINHRFPSSCTDPISVTDWSDKCGCSAACALLPQTWLKSA